jgi:hypothetical protein
MAFQPRNMAPYGVDSGFLRRPSAHAMHYDAPSASLLESSTLRADSHRCVLWHSIDGAWQSAARAGCHERRARSPSSRGSRQSHLLGPIARWTKCLPFDAWHLVRETLARPSSGALPIASGMALGRLCRAPITSAAVATHVPGPRHTQLGDGLGGLSRPLTGQADCQAP